MKESVNREAVDQSLISSDRLADKFITDRVKKSGEEKELANSQVHTQYKSRLLFSVSTDTYLCVKMAVSGLSKKWNDLFSHQQLVDDMKPTEFLLLLLLSNVYSAV